MAEPSTRFVLCGDVNGNLDQLHKVLTKIKESDAFGACFCTGSFFKATDGEASSLSEAELTLSDAERAFVSGSRQFPLPVAFVDSSASPLGAWLRSSCPHGADLAPNFRFLGAYGVYKFGSSGIRLAFVSGLEHPHRPPIAEGPTELFRGAYFTTELIERMHSIRAAEAGSVDLLLTCMWPSRLEKFLSDECRGLLDEALKVGAEEIGFSDQISEWSRDFESRYHVAAGKGCFYQRPPFAGSTFGYCRRFVGLASLSSGQKTAKPLMKSMHALDLCHLRCKCASTLKALPPNCTSDPLTSSKRPLPVVSEEAPPRKIVRVEDDRRATPGSSRSVHVGNLPFEFSSDSLVDVMSYFGEIEDVRFPKTPDGRSKGSAWITFKSLEGAARAVDANQRLESGNRLLRVQYARNAPRRDVDIDTRAHKECWFCLVNPNGEKRLIVDIGTLAYTALAKGGVNSNHVLVVPIVHIPCLALADDGLLAETAETVKRVTQTLAENEGAEDFVVFERYFPMRNSAVMHTQLQLVPLARLPDEVEPKLLAAGMDKKLQLVPFDGGVSLLKHEICRRQGTGAFDEYWSYTFIMISAKGTVNSYLSLSPPDSRMPSNFAREFVADVMSNPSLAEWRHCVQSEAVETEMATRMKNYLRQSPTPSDTRPSVCARAPWNHDKRCVTNSVS